MISLDKKKISKFVEDIVKQRNLLFLLTKPSRLSTIYWYVASIRILKTEITNKDELINYVLSCKNNDAFFGGDIGYPSNILSTLNALQIFYTIGYHYYDENILKNISLYFNEEGSVKSDDFGEKDTRFSCCAILIIYFLYLNKKYNSCKFEYIGEKMDMEFLKSYNINIDNFVSYLLKCQNFDGGFGAVIGAESHSANTFCVISTLRTLDLLDLIDVDSVTRFLVYRQCEGGGFNGRINKKEDVCYSYWAFSSLVMLKKSDYIDNEKLKTFIYSCLDESGGFADRKGNMPDLYHTLYAIAALSILGDDSLAKADPGVGI